MSMVATFGIFVVRFQNKALSMISVIPWSLLWEGNFLNTLNVSARYLNKFKYKTDGNNAIKKLKKN